MNPPITDPSPDAVRELLKRQSNQTEEEMNAQPPAVKRSVELDTEASETVMNALGMQHTEKQYQAQESPHIPVEVPSYAKETYDPMKFSELWDWMSSSDTIGTVVVTQEERNIYRQAVIEDGELELRCEVDYGGLQTVVARDLTMYENDLMAAALAEDQNKRLIVSPYERLAHVQQYAIMMHIVSVNDLPFNFFKGTGVLMTDMVALRERRVQVMHSMRSARVSLLLRAVMIFEKKMQMLHEAAANKTKRDSFSDPRTVA